jgi:hypothetical protein
MTSEPEFIGPNSGESFRETVLRLILERKYKKRLPPKFWNLPAYKPDYTYQIRILAGLTKIYSKVAIHRTLELMGWVWSLNNPKFQQALDEEQKKMDRAAATSTKKVDEPIIPPVLKTTPPPTFRRKKKEDFKDGEK